MVSDMNPLRLLLLCIVFMLPGLARAEVYAQEFSATIFEIDGKSKGLVNIGDTLTGRFQYPDITSVSEKADSGLVDLAVTFAGMVFDLTSNDNLFINTSNWFQSQFTIYASVGGIDGGPGRGSITLSLYGPMDTYPTGTVPDQFDLSKLTLKQIEFFVDGYYVRANLIQITPVAPVSVPEPNAVALLIFAIGLFAVGIIRRSKRAA